MKGCFQSCNLFKGKCNISINMNNIDTQEAHFLRHVGKCRRKEILNNPFIVPPTHPSLTHAHTERGKVFFYRIRDIPGNSGATLQRP